MAAPLPPPWSLNSLQLQRVNAVRNIRPPQPAFAIRNNNAAINPPIQETPSLFSLPHARVVNPRIEQNNLLARPAQPAQPAQPRENVRGGRRKTRRNKCHAKKTRRHRRNRRNRKH